MKDNLKLKPDSVLKEYWRNNDRFADIFNQIFFYGQHTITASLLSDQDTDESAVIMDGNQAISILRTRDIIKQYANGVEFVLIGLENQTNIHYAMPIRTMLYDALRYTRQCKELEQKNRAGNRLRNSNEFLSGITKKDRLKPVITLVIYYGEEPWDGPLHLNDMMEDSSLFMEFHQNHSVHLLQMSDARHFTFENQDNHDFFTILDEFYRNNGKFDPNTFNGKYPDLKIDWETLTAIGAASGSLELINYVRQHKGGRIHMCKAIDNLMEEGREEGRMESLHKTVKLLRQLNINDHIILEKLKEEFKLNDEEARKYMFSN